MVAIIFMMLFFIIFLGIVLKRNILIEISIIAFMVLLSAGRTDGADYNNYLLNYGYTTNFNVNGWEYLYQISVLMAKSINLSFHQFIFFYFLVGILLMLFTIKKCTGSSVGVFLLYIVYPFAMDIVHIRFFMADAIVIFSLRFLFSEKRFDFIKFIIGIIIATFFHTSALAFIALLFAKYINEDNLRIIGVVVAGGAFIIFPQLDKWLKMLDISFISRKLFYFTEGTENLTKILIIALLLISCVFFEFTYRTYRGEDKNIIRILKNINYVSLLFYPFFIASIDFLRLHRVVAICNYIICAKYEGKNKSLIKIGGIVYAVVCFIAFIASYTWESMIEKLFISNIIFRW